MSTNSMRKIDQKEYLKKYLSGDKVKKKKKDKKHKKSSSSSHVKVKIIDDEVNHLDTGPKIDEELLLTGDDAPQIVGEYIEENPAESKLPKWKSIGIKEEPQNDEEDLWGKKSTDLKSKKEYFVDKQFSVKTPDSSPRRRSSPRRKHNSPSPGRKYKKNKSPHRTQRSDYTSSDNGNKIKREFITPDKSPTHRRQDRNDDYSPPRRKAPKKIRRNNSTDLTPPRNKKSYDSLSSRRREECNLSPLRKRNNDSPDLRQSRRRRSSDQTQRKRRNHSSDQSPPRRDRESSSDQSPSIKRKNTERSQLQKSTKRPLDQSPRRRRNSDYSPLRKGRNHSPDQSPIRNIRNSDLTPSRRGRKHSLDQSPPRRRRNSDQSPPRKGRNRSPDQSPIRNIRNSDQSPSRRERQNSLDQSPTRRRRNSDQSPPRKGRNRSPDQSPIRNKRCLDQLPLRKGRKHSPDQSPPRRRRNSDQSPPRINRNSQRDAMLDSSSRSRSRTDPTKYIKREKLSPALSPPLPRRSRWERQETEKSLSPPPTHKPKPGKTLEGKTAGLQDAHALHKESLERRKQEDLLFEKMSSDISGRHAEVQVRSTGRKGRRAREALEEDPEERKRKEEHDEKKKQLYDRWGKGLKQIEDHKNRLLEQAHESSKPLARYEDDEDLERHLKEQERAEDPMLEYMRQKRKEKEKHSGKPQIPRYEGSFPENRFGIRPGYRWDGVDRSNGYEKKYFSVQNEKRARQDEAYKYSVEDM